MPSPDDLDALAPMLWVYGTHAGEEHKTAIVPWHSESLRDAMTRGCGYILLHLDNTEAGGVDHLTNVRAETFDEFEFRRGPLLIGVRIPGGILTMTREGPR